VKAREHSIDQLLSVSTLDEAKSAELAELTELDRTDLNSFTQTWSKLEPHRREGILRRLIELAEDNVELNFDAIFKSCMTDPDAVVRKLAIEGLWENEKPGLIDPLLRLLSEDESADVRAAAASALGKFTLLGEHGKLGDSYVKRVKDALLQTFNDDRNVDELRRRALESLATLSTTETKMAIANAYSRGNLRLKVGALYAMGKSCDHEWMPILLAELGNSDAEIRYEAAVALGEVGTEEAVPRLIEHGVDLDSEVQRASIEALGKIGGTKAKEYLQTCMSSRNDAIRETARHALNELQANDDPLSIPL
jgi:HEAT repeat protein